MTLFLILRSFIGVGCGVILLFIGLFPQRIIGWSDWHTMSHYETNFNIIFLIGSSLNVVYCAGKFIINRKAGSPSFFRHNNALSDQMPLLLFRIISCIRRELTSLTFAQEYVKGRSICHYFFLIISDGLNKIVARKHHLIFLIFWRLLSCSSIRSVYVCNCCLNSPSYSSL